MAIQTGDVKLLASAVMDDVPEGGGAPTSTVIADNASNAIFKDISESDRARGRVNMSKVFASVQTGDTDTYLGANVVVAKPPSDANVSITLFTTNSVYDTRSAAQTRLEAYLNKGPEWGGFLFEDHIAGQRAIQLFQRPTAEVPAVGKTLVLIQDEGLATETVQYVRATKVSAVTRTFTYNTDQDYQASIVTIELSDALRYDFDGSPATRQFSRATGKTITRDTNVADAGSYVGVVPLSQAIAIGDYTIKVGTTYSQLVPSAQTETPIAAASPFGTLVSPVAASSALTFSSSAAWTTTTSLNLPNGCLPGSISIVSGSTTITDKAGKLLVGTTQIGTVDYINGILTLSTGSYSGAKTVTYKPAAYPAVQPQSASIAVTAESRSQSYTGFISPTAAPGTLSVAYLVQNRWYVLSDDGAGRLAGYDASYGAGTYSQTTGGFIVTLGALPDVGSSIILQWGIPTQESALPQANLPLSQTVALTAPDGKMVRAGTLTLAWNDGSAKTAAAGTGGVITGSATGSVDLVRKTVTFAPTTLPPVGTQVTIGFDYGDATAQTLTPSRTGTNPITFTLGSGSLTPGSVQLSWNATPDLSSYGAFTTNAMVQMGIYPSSVQILAHDNGSGRIIRDSDSADLGSINYSTGAVSINPDTTGTIKVPDVSSGYSSWPLS